MLEAFPKARMVTVNECASHAAVLAAIGPAEGSGEQSLARELYPRLEQDWLPIADRNFLQLGQLAHGRGCLHRPIHRRGRGQYAPGLRVRQRPGQ
jgi:hypothetical protein